MSTLESKAKTIVFLSNECFYKNANFEQLWVPLEDAQKEIEKHKEANEILFVANNYQADKIKGLEAKIASYKTKIDELEVEKQNLRDRSSNAYYLERLVASGINLKVLAVTEENVSGCRFLVTLENGLQTWNARKVKVGSTMRFTADYVKLMEECRDAKVKAQTIKN